MDPVRSIIPVRCAARPMGQVQTKPFSLQLLPFILVLRPKKNGRGALTLPVL
jgi:hypothetical protein